MSDTKKLPIPGVDSKEPLKKSCNTNKSVLWSVTFYAGAVTAALVCVCVYGAIYKPTAEMPAVQDVRHYHEDSDNKSDDYDLDLGRNREVLYQTSADGNRTMLVLDFKENTGGMYSSQLPYCVMMQDFGDDVPDVLEVQRRLDNLSVNESITLEMDYIIEPSLPVDLSRLPQELIEPCWGMEVYKLVKDDEDQGGRIRRWVRKEVYYETIGGKVYRVKVKYRRDGSIKKKKSRRRGW